MTVAMLRSPCTKTETEELVQPPGRAEVSCKMKPVALVGHAVCMLPPENETVRTGRRVTPVITKSSTRKPEGLAAAPPLFTTKTRLERAHWWAHRQSVPRRPDRRWKSGRNEGQVGRRRAPRRCCPRLC